MPSDDAIEDDELKITPWDRRVVAAVAVADGARKGVRILRVSAVGIALFAVIGSAFAYFSEVDTGGDVFERNIDRQTVGSFVASLAVPLAFAGLVFAFSYLIQLSAARLDVDIVLADEDETESA